MIFDIIRLLFISKHARINKTKYNTFHKVITKKLKLAKPNLF